MPSRRNFAREFLQRDDAYVGFSSFWAQLRLILWDDPRVNYRVWTWSHENQKILSMFLRPILILVAALLPCWLLSGHVAPMYTAAPVNGNGAFVVQVTLIQNDNATLPRLMMSTLDQVQGYVFCDIGSTDGSSAYLRKLRDRYNLTRNLFVEELPWAYHYARAREACVALARKRFHGRFDYLLMMDASDMLAPVDKHWRHSLPSADHPFVEVKVGTQWEPRMFHWMSKDMPVYKCAAYEYVQRPQNSTRRVRYPHLRIARRRPENQSDKLTYLRAALEPHLGSRASTGCRARNYFYWGQVLLEQKKYAMAVHAFDKRLAEDDDYEEERYYAAYRRAVALYMAQDKPNITAVQQAFVDAWQMRPTRAEALHYLAHVFKNEEKWPRCWTVAEKLAPIQRPSEDTLFVDDVYRPNYNYELVATCAYHAGNVARARQAWGVALDYTSPDATVDVNRIRANLRIIDRLGK